MRPYNEPRTKHLIFMPTNDIEAPFLLLKTSAWTLIRFLRSFYFSFVAKGAQVKDKEKKKKKRRMNLFFFLLLRPSPSSSSSPSPPLSSVRESRKTKQKVEQKSAPTRVSLSSLLSFVDFTPLPSVLLNSHTLPFFIPFRLKTLFLHTPPRSMMTSYEGLRKLTLGDKPVIIKCTLFSMHSHTLSYYFRHLQTLIR